MKEASGEQRSGRVMYIHRTYLFLLNRDSTENAGVFVARSSGVLTVAAKGRGNNAGPDLAKMNPALQRGANGAGMAPPPVQRGPDRLLGKTVTIKRGSYKGLLGIVKDTTQTEARVELHTKSRLVTVPKEHVIVKDQYGNNVDMSRFNGPMRTGVGVESGSGSYSGGYAGAATPRVPYGAGGGGGGWDGGRTPAVAGGFGGMTPAWGSGGGSKTPIWGPGRGGSNNSNSYSSFASGSRTPAAAASAGAGNRTAYGGAGSYGGATSYGGGGGGGGTSHWNPNSSTPHHSGFSGSRTPAGAGFGAKTPMHGWDAATPGFAAATPADHPTPRGAAPYGQRTPYAADTPFGGNGSRTPGFGGGDEGYE